MNKRERSEMHRATPPTPAELRRAKRVRIALWALFIILFVVLPITRPLRS